MTDVRGKPAMLAIYCEEVKIRAAKLRSIRQSLAVPRRRSEVQFFQKMREKLVIEVRCLIELRRRAKAFSRERIAARRAVEGERKVPRKVGDMPAPPPGA